MHKGGFFLDMCGERGMKLVQHFLKLSVQGTLNTRFGHK